MHLIRLVRVALAAIAIGASAAATLYPSPTHAQPRLQVLAVTGGQPDDITTDTHGRLVWGNLSRGTVERVQGRRITTVLSGLSVPEGIVVLRNGVMLLAEQGYDRVDRISQGGRIIVLYRLQPVGGQEGLDGIDLDPRSGDILVADSPRGVVLRLNQHTGRARVIASGLGRPVDAVVDRHGNVLVPDEHLGTLVAISPRGRVSYRGSFATPDDVAVDRSGRIWLTSLGDGGLWLLTPHSGPRRVLSGLANPQGLTLDRCGDPIIVEQNTGRIVRLLLTSRAEHCAL